MKSLNILAGVVCTCLLSSAQVPEVRPQVAGRAVQEGQVTVVYLAPRFATAIRMPDAVNSVVLGDPDSFTAEHSEREPQIVFVKPITEKAAQTNLLISTTRGYQANLLLISRGQPAGTQPNVDFMMRYRPAARFIIEQSAPSLSIAQTEVLPAPDKKTEPPAIPSPAGQLKTRSSIDVDRPPIERASFHSTNFDSVPNPAAADTVQPVAKPADAASALDDLLVRQRRAPLPTLYGEKPGVAPPGKQILKAGVSEVIDHGREVVVLFSVVNVQNHAVELMPPQVQLGGKVKKGAIVRHSVWSNSEQLPVEEFRMSQRRIGPGERADGVLVFHRPSFKQSNETLLLQMADSGAVDRPALAPIGFGISSFDRKEPNNMTPEMRRDDGRPEETDRDVTRRIGHETAAEPPEAVEPEEKRTLFASLREGYLRARDGRTKGQTEKQTRAGKSVDRSKGLLVLAVAVVIMIFVFLGMFSSSSGTRDRATNRNPSLGRPEMPASGTTANHGSVTPLLNADMSGQDGNSDQVSADDVKATGRLRMPPQPKAANPLASVPPMDPALDAYRQAKAGYPMPSPTVASSAPSTAPPPPPVHSEADALKKSSLVFVGNTSGASSMVRTASMGTEPALLERRATALLPNGTRLVARLQSTVSTAVKTPVVAAIEYNYERDGEIIIPAGTKAFGDLQQANRNGNIGIRFHTLQMPDGTTEKIGAGAMSLTYGPLKGSVSGGNTVKRVLVRSMTGVGTMAAYLVGGPGGFGGVNGQINNSILLRERIASNAGLAGEQEMSSLAFNENIVVSVPGNTRFFIVLLEGSGE